jgi:hypothetical protein
MKILKFVQFIEELDLSTHGSVEIEVLKFNRFAAHLYQDGIECDFDFGDLEELVDIYPNSVQVKDRYTLIISDTDEMKQIVNVSKMAYIRTFHNINIKELWNKK